jgi:aminobenzoyl-glutamate utilization protein B
MSDRAAAAKAGIFARLDRDALAITGLSDRLFYFAELGMQEHESAALMCTLLEEAGFQVTQHLSGFPTGFLAIYGHGAPVVALHTEYDANPGNSQVSGVAERQEIVPGSPGHCEGHNVNGAVMVAAAIALKHEMAAQGLPGTIKIFGAPAEEQLVSRPYFVRDGHFDDVDVALHNHIGWEFRSVHGQIQSAMVSATFTFHGETAHAAMVPWKGRDALDAVVLMDVGLAQYREHMPPGTTAHRAITDGGSQPNVIPARASVWWYFRDKTAEGARALFEQACRIAEGAAMMSNCSVVTEILSGVWGTRCNRIVGEVAQRNAELVGMPAWSETEHALAREVQRAAGLPEEGLRTACAPFSEVKVPGTSSNDSGDVSWCVPMARLYFPANIPHVRYHHWSAGVALATSIAHKGALAGAKAVAGTMLDFLLSPELIEAAKASFAEEIAETRYRPLIPADQTPPVTMNLATMDRYREAMRAHYPKGSIAFGGP